MCICEILLYSCPKYFGLKPPRPLSYYEVNEEVIKRQILFYVKFGLGTRDLGMSVQCEAGSRRRHYRPYRPADIFVPN